MMPEKAIITLISNMSLRHSFVQKLRRFIFFIRQAISGASHGFYIIADLAEFAT